MNDQNRSPNVKFHHVTQYFTGVKFNFYLILILKYKSFFNMKLDELN